MIYVITHKNFDDKLFNTHTHKVFFVGKDDVIGDNISNKNNIYSELTAAYYLWKNVKINPNEIIGIEHYRRCFLSEQVDNTYEPIHDIDIKNILNQFQCIIAKRHITLTRCSIYDEYKNLHNIEDLELLKNVMKKNHKEYFDDLVNILEGNYFNPTNMIITTKKIFDEYFEWLFSILFELEKEIDFNKYQNEYQKRALGFIAERLMTVYINKNKIVYCELPVLVVR